MSSEAAVKSIIFGNCYSNRYGKFRALCAALTQKSHIDRAMGYLRSVDNLKSFNKFIYAYRLEDSNPLFVTEESRHNGFSEGYHQDSGVEGTGQRLLHVMQKFDVKSILLIVAIGQKDPLQELNSEHQMSVMKCAKQLLVSLYEKVMPQNQQVSFDNKSSIQQKFFVLPDIYNPPRFKDSKFRENNRPNYVGQLHIPERNKTKQQLKNIYQTKYLSNFQIIHTTR